MDLRRLEEIGTPCAVTNRLEHRAVDRSTFIGNLHLWSANNPYRQSQTHSLFRVSPITANRLNDQTYPIPIKPQMEHSSSWQAFFDEWLPHEGNHFPETWVELGFNRYEDAIDQTRRPLLHERFYVECMDFFLSEPPVCLGPLESILYSDHLSFIEYARAFCLFLFQDIQGLECCSKWMKDNMLERSMLKGYFLELRFMVISIWRQLSHFDDLRWGHILPLEWFGDDDVPYIVIPMTNEGLRIYDDIVRVTQPLKDALLHLFESAGPLWLNDTDVGPFEGADGRQIYDERLHSFLPSEVVREDADIWWSMFLARCFPQTHKTPYSWRHP